ncbi:PHD and RING finger domain-containing protein [Venturia nashicola]|uniref:PHD and RING finger domain-containing protein n=1 Tax=Venturia nashicola TaxID=86259 RepID=A0A4Z1NMM2_9PEZI|nr:PHD and RING finger domain-containing protein [Venturia nashicola]
MAESCIVCLGDLYQDDPGASIAEVASKSPLEHNDGDAANPSSTPPPQLPEGEPELIAHLLPCGHFLHDECLKPWVERANSCPVCRQTFNMVEVSASLKGPVVSSYAVQDKQQVADIDPTMIVEEDLFDEHDGPCMVCEAVGDESVLLLCDGCSNTCHVMCAGLDRIPAGAWFCYTCTEDPQILANNVTPSVRRRQGRRRGREPAWERVWRSVFDRLHFDLEFPFDEEEESLPTRQRVEAERREFQEWRRRFDVAARQGAATRFRNTAAIVRQPERRRPSPESPEEIRAWNAFEKARAAEDGQNEPARNRRKRKSPTASPRETPTEPERRLKRPRTARRPQNVADAPEGVGESSRAASSRPVAPAAIRPPRAFSRVEANGAPTFLESLISEVEAHPPAGGQEENPWTDYNSDGAERSPSPQNYSPDASPANSNHASPRNMTPPPHSPIMRPVSPPLASMITPVFPPAPDFSPFSPIADSVERARSRHRSKHTSPSHSPSHSPTRAPISYEMKSEIQKMVSGVLKPHYAKKLVDKDTFTDINRDISRMLYDRVWDDGGFVDKAARDRWERIAIEEVEKAVQDAKMRQDKRKEEEEAAITTTPGHDIPVRSSAAVSA